jgi:hypothetical protein
MQARPGSKLLTFHARLRVVVLCFAAALCLTSAARADEGGVSFWVPGFFGSLAAAPAQPGWAFAAINYYDSVRASGNVAAARQVTINRFNATVNVNLNANLKANPDLVLAIPSYTFATPVFGGQFQLALLATYGRSITEVNGTLTASAGPFAKASSRMHATASAILSQWRRCAGTTASTIG